FHVTGVQTCALPISSRMTSPPLPPLPPSGPPSGLNFSRRMEATPLPPLPPATCSTTRSTKLAISPPTVCGYSSGGGRHLPSAPVGSVEALLLRPRPRRR